MLVTREEISLGALNCWGTELVRYYPVKARGFTLIEVLIALTISGLLLALLSQAFYMVTRQWEDRFIVQVKAIEQVHKKFLLERSLAGMVPMLGADAKSIRFRLPQFSGSADSMQWITAMPVLLGDSGVAQAELSHVEHNGEQYWQYYERPLGRSLEADNVTPSVSRLMLWPVEEEQLAYLGYVDIVQRLTEVDKREAPVWRSEYRADESGQLPLGVSIRHRSTADLTLVVVIPHTNLAYLQGGE
jgi:prepilin-type N-terminal cleavage/methylation domain-containing protein